jgi:hypothetical protein
MLCLQTTTNSYELHIIGIIFIDTAHNTQIPNERDAEGICDAQARRGPRIQILNGLGPLFLAWNRAYEYVPQRLQSEKKHRRQLETDVCSNRLAIVAVLLGGVGQKDYPRCLR